MSKKSPGLDLRAALTNKAWSGIARAAGMYMFQFGELVARPSIRGGTRYVGEFSLHVQCSWRIVRRAAIVIGIGDALAGGSWRRTDVGLDQLVTAARSRRRVTGVEFDSGDLTIRMPLGDLEVWADASGVEEHWRLLANGEPRGDLVCNGAALEWLEWHGDRPKS